MLEVPHALGQGLHFAQAFVDLLQPLGHLLEALAQAGFEGALQLLVHRLAHLVEFGGVAGLQLGELLLHGAAHLGQAAGVGFAQVLQLGAQRFGQCLAQGGDLLREGIEPLGLGACALHALLHQCTLQAGELLGKGVDLGVLGAGGFCPLGQQGLLKACQGLGALLPASPSRFSDFLAQVALSPVHSSPHPGTHGRSQCGRVQRRLAQQQPQQQHQVQGQQQGNGDQFKIHANLLSKKKLGAYLYPRRNGIFITKNGPQRAFSGTRCSRPAMSRHWRKSTRLHTSANSAASSQLSGSTRLQSSAT